MGGPFTRKSYGWLSRCFPPPELLLGGGLGNWGRKLKRKPPILRLSFSELLSTPTPNEDISPEAKKLAKASPRYGVGVNPLTLQ